MLHLGMQVTEVKRGQLSWSRGCAGGIMKSKQGSPVGEGDMSQVQAGV